ncbi:hypothetical protein R3P38DRAFT_3242659 [Favolaschia claudopus]|uniref:Secreted protein n=1 Tax=Favolaschia claudopus TaxID=2862362 RepID=A0AAV9Z475_9AGAR
MHARSLYPLPSPLVLVTVIVTTIYTIPPTPTRTLPHSSRPPHPYHTNNSQAKLSRLSRRGCTTSAPPAAAPPHPHQQLASSRD